MQNKLNTGALFRNEKPRSPQSPTHTGSINVDGKEYSISAWVKESKNGNRFFSLSVNPK